MVGNSANMARTDFENRLAAPMAWNQVQELLTAPLSHVYKRELESSSNKCTNNDKSALCGKPSETNDVTLPIVLGIAIPLSAALILFLFLHRRHVRKLRQEDANDPHKSLDFGLSPSASQKDKETRARNMVTDPDGEKAVKHKYGLSMDIVSPYLLPPDLQNSRESLHSLSRTMHNADDRYRPATTFSADDESSMRSSPAVRTGADDSSSFADSGFSGRGYGNDTMEQSLLQNAQRMSTSRPPMQHVPEVARDAQGSYKAYPGSASDRSNCYLGPVIHSGDPLTDIIPPLPKQTLNEQAPSPPTGYQSPKSRNSPPPTTGAASALVRPPRLQSLNSPAEKQYESTAWDEASRYGEVFQVTPPSPKHSGVPQRNKFADQETALPRSDKRVDAMGTPSPAFDVRRLSMGFRPLPPDDPTDNAEQRAIRIRSFYKEYFDDSKPGPVRAQGDYTEDHNEIYLGSGAYYGLPGHFPAQTPFAEPPNRRAMTPPPRAPPRFQVPARPHASSVSGGRSTPRGPGPRFSSASDRVGLPARGSSRPALPAPGPLRILPSPHLVKEDSFGIPIDFAPPTSYKDRQAGRPDSPQGGMRPYSPMVPAHLPLVSAFDDLSVMPSPHLLRKSGTFTALDFAPPPRFKNSDHGSDAGSIRSNRSAMSAQQLQSIRAGAYRVSRIPKEVVGTRNEINDSLKPQWGMRP